MVRCRFHAYETASPAQRFAWVMALAGAASGCSSGKSPSPACSIADAQTPPKAQTSAGPIDLFVVIGPAADCVTCVRDNCGAAMNACANSERCQEGLLCTLAKCAPANLSNGSLLDATDLGCVSSCFGNDLAAALKAVGIATCLAQKCGTTCSEVFPTRPVEAAWDGGWVVPAPTRSNIDAESPVVTLDAEGDSLDGDSLSEDGAEPGGATPSVADPAPVRQRH